MSTHVHAARRFASALALGWLAASCGNLQRLPGPMPYGSADEPFVESQPIARLIRHGDPVQWRPAGEAGSVMLAFYDKETVLTEGSWVFTGAPGRAELLRPDEGSSAVLFGISAVEIGNGVETPWLHVVKLDRVWLRLVPGDRVGLPGGAVLQAEGEGKLPAGPFLLTSLSPDVYRVHNQGLRPARVHYRDQTLVIEPSERLGLARIGSAYGGTAPMLERTREVSLGDRSAQVLGDVAVAPAGDGAWVLTARGGPAVVFVQGLRLDLADGETAEWRFPAETPSAP
ncbi:MAG: hypothetical protein WD226_04580 [Planctomycetota bacterium]